MVHDSGYAKVPTNWQKFLQNADNKKELFSFLSTQLMEVKFQNDKSVNVTLGEQVLNTDNGTPMDQCNYEEAHTRVLVHHLRALQSSSLGLVKTRDTDVVIILLRNLRHITAANPAAQIWISFKTSKSVKMISPNRIASGAKHWLLFIGQRG